VDFGTCFIPNQKGVKKEG